MDNTLLIDDSPYKNMRNGMWSAIHPLPFHIVNEPAGHRFGQRRLLPDDGEAKRVLLSCMAGPRALELA